MPLPDPELGVNESVLAMRERLEAVKEEGHAGWVFPVDIVERVIDQAEVVVVATSDQMGSALVELASGLVRERRSVGKPIVLSLVVANALLDLASTLHEPPAAQEVI